MDRLLSRKTSAGQPASRKRADDRREDAEVVQSIPISTGAVQPAVILSPSSAESHPSSSALRLSSSAGQPAPNEREEEQPNKRRKQDGTSVCVKDLVTPEILQPFQTALAEQIEQFKEECEHWDPPVFGEDDNRPKFQLRFVYMRVCSILKHRCPPQPAYAVIKGLLALIHSDVDSAACRSSKKKEQAANKLYAEFYSSQVPTIELEVGNLELLAVAVRQQMVEGKHDHRKDTGRYVEYLAEFAKLHGLQEVRADPAS